jgi:signal transduction histidine kinase
MKSFAVIDRRAFIAGLIALAVMVLTFVGAFMWVQHRVMHLHDEELRSTLLGELELRRQFDRTSGRAKLIEGLAWRSSIVDATRYLVLLDSAGKPAVGNPGMLPEESLQRISKQGWFRVRDEAGPDIFVVGLTLDDGAKLLMSYRDPIRRDMAQTLGQTAVLGVLLIVTIGIATGLIFNHYALTQIRHIAHTARRIQRGQMTARAPVSQRVDAMGALARTLNEMLDQNEALVTGLRTITESLAHDLRTPMMRIRRSIESARSTSSEAERQAHLAEAEAGITRSLQVFNALVDLARAEAGLAYESMEVLDLGTLATDLAELFEPLAEERGQKLERRIRAVMVTGHRQILSQAVGNLLENAIKYSPAGAVLSVSVETMDDGTPEIVVQDRGPGIPVNAREQAVRPFVRLEGASGEFGSGLGLAIAAAVARLHRGKLVLESADPGLRVRLRFGHA